MRHSRRATSKNQRPAACDMWRLVQGEIGTDHGRRHRGGGGGEWGGAPPPPPRFRISGEFPPRNRDF